MKRGKWYVYKPGEDYKVFDTFEEADAYDNPVVAKEKEEDPWLVDLSEI